MAYMIDGIDGRQQSLRMRPQDDEYEDETEDEFGNERYDDNYDYDGDDDSGEWLSEFHKEEPGIQQVVAWNWQACRKNVWVMSEGRDEAMIARIRPTLATDESDWF